jgi:hypothetical protein
MYYAADLWFPKGNLKHAYKERAKSHYEPKLYNCIMEIWMVTVGSCVKLAVADDLTWDWMWESCNSSGGIALVKGGNL